MGEQPPEPPTVTEYLMWLRLERGRAESTVEAYRRDLRDLAAFLATLDREVSAASEDDLVAFAAHQRTTGVAASTAKRRVVAARNLYRYLAEEGIIDHDPGADLAPPPVPRGLPRALSEQEVTAVIESVEGDDPVARRDRAILETLYGAGLRISELVGMDLADLDLHDGYLRVVGKGDRQRVVPIVGQAATALTDWLDADARGALGSGRRRSRDDESAVFVNQRGGRLSRQGAWGVVKQHGTRAGLGERLTPHVFRHSCATHLLDGGADIRIVQELLGHASIATTQVYTAVSTERLVAAWRSAHPRAR